MSISQGRKGGSFVYRRQQDVDTSIAAMWCYRSGRSLSPIYVNRTHTAQDQEQCLLAAELVISAQKNAHRLHVKA